MPLSHISRLPNDLPKRDISRWSCSYCMYFAKPLQWLFNWTAIVVIDQKESFVMEWPCSNCIANFKFVPRQANFAMVLRGHCYSSITEWIDRHTDRQFKVITNLTQIFEGGQSPKMAFPFLYSSITIEVQNHQFCP